MNNLFSDLKTDQEKSAFFLSGRGYETGVIAPAIQNDVAMAYHRCAEYEKEVQALRKDAERLHLLTMDCSPWSIYWEKIGRKPARYKMRKYGEKVGPWFDSAVEAIDHARRIEGEGE